MLKVRTTLKDPQDVARFLDGSAQDFGARLQHARKSLGLTQQQCAEAAGIPLPSHKQYERGIRIPGGDAIGAYARAGINANWLTAGHGPMLLQDLVPAGALDADLMRAVVVGIEQALTELHLALAPEKKFELQMALYELARESRVQPSRTTIIRLVRSAA